MRSCRVRVFFLNYGASSQPRVTSVVVMLCSGPFDVCVFSPTCHGCVVAAIFDLSLAGVCSCYIVAGWLWAVLGAALVLGAPLLPGSECPVVRQCYVGYVVADLVKLCC